MSARGVLRLCAMAAWLWLSLSLSLLPTACTASSSSSGDERYLIMIDGGSTGSRVYIHRYTWPLLADGSRAPLPVIEPAKSAPLRPGLSSFAARPENATQQVAGLLAVAREHIPQRLWTSTPIHLQATAGLRSLTAAQASAVLRVVREALRASEFLFKDEWALIISGEQEGINGWLATNYLLGAFDPSTPTEAHGVVEMGGASMQITFAPLSTAGLSPSARARLAHLTLASRDYFLYTHSYLAYGLQAAQKLYQQLMMEQIEDEGNPCYPVGWRHSSTGNFARCFELMAKVVDTKKECETEPCAFNGVWQPQIAGEPFLAIENFFYTSRFFSREEGVVKRGVVATGNLLVRTLKERGVDYCDDPWSQILQDHRAALDAGTEAESSLSYYCFAAAYEAAVLEVGFGFVDRSNIRPARTVDGKAIDWELGATLIELMRHEGVDVMQNPHVTAWSVGLWGACSSWTCRSSALLLALVLMAAACTCARALRRDPMQRGYSMLHHHHGERGGGLSALFGGSKA